MLYKAITSFSGVLSMAEGEVREISDSSLIDDLSQAGYIIPLKPDDSTKAKAKPKKTNKGKGKNKNEN